MSILFPIPNLVKALTRHTVELTDMDGKSFRIQLALSSFGIAEVVAPGNSTFRVLDEGFIRYRAGGCLVLKEAQGIPRLPLYLRMANIWGIRLEEFYGGVGILRNSGAGEVLQSWVTSLKPGKIGWVLV